MLSGSLAILDSPPNDKEHTHDQHPFEAHHRHGGGRCRNQQRSDRHRGYLGHEHHIYDRRHPAPPPNGAPGQQHDPSKGGHTVNGKTETLLTGDVEAKVRAAALAKVPARSSASRRTSTRARRTRRTS